MKETKKFFDNNRLNKGYNERKNYKQSNYSGESDIIRNKYKHILPPIDIIAEYEELSPGTAEKLFDMAQREQNHRHALDLLTIAKQDKAIKMGRIFSLILVTIITLGTIILTFMSHLIGASVFCACAFLTIAGVSFFSLKKLSPRPSLRNFNIKPFNNKRIYPSKK